MRVKNKAKKVTQRRKLDKKFDRLKQNTRYCSMINISSNNKSAPEARNDHCFFLVEINFYKIM